MTSASDTAIPGTAHLVDLVGSLDVRHSETGPRDVILLPQPTSDPNDPLNWSRRRKLTVSIALLTVMFMGNIQTNLLTPVIVDIEKDTGISVSTLNQGFSIQYLFYGWADIFWVPLAVNYGRRPVLLGTALALIAVSIWTPFVTGSGEWHVNRILAGSFYAPLEIVIELAFTDMYFVHERGLWINLFSLTLFGTVFTGIIPAGYVSVALGWRWIQYIAVIISAVCWVFLFFCLEETMYYRPPVPQTNAQQEDKTKVEEDHSPESNVPPKAKENPAAAEIGSPPNVECGQVMKRKTFASRLKFWGARRPGQPNNFWQSLWIPFMLVRFPVILMSGVLFGSTLMWYLVITSTTALTLTEPPYNFNSNEVGLMFAAPLTGVCVGCAIAAIYSNRIAVWLARRRGGVFEPEYRLWLLVAPTVLHFGSCFLWGVGAKQGIHWIGLAIAMCIMMGTLSVGATVAINYIIDTYQEVSGDALVTMLCIRTTMGFALGYGVTPWYLAVGVEKLYITIAFLGLVFWLVGLSFIYFGKRTRRGTAMAYWRLLEKYGLRAH